MIAISDKLRHQVMKLAEQYEKPEFITDDPVQFPRRFGYKCSQEIVGFIAAWLAYGNGKPSSLPVRNYVRRWNV